MSVSYSSEGVRLKRDATDVSSRSIYMLSGNFSLRRVLLPVCRAPKRKMLSSNSLSIFNLRSIMSVYVICLY